MWMAPNHIKAIWKVLVAENPIVKKLFNFEIGFSVRRNSNVHVACNLAALSALLVTMLCHVQ